MKKLFVFLVILVCSCGSGNVITTDELDQVFTQKEIKDLNTLVAYFESKIISDSLSTDASYKNWIKKLSDLDQNPWSDFSFSDQLEIYKSIDQNTFNEIWTFNQIMYPKTKDTLKELGLTYDKKYHNYLKLLGEESPRMKWYATKSSESGDLPQFFDLQSLFVKVDTIHEQHKIQEFYDFNERLIITISSLKYADNFYRKEKWRNDD